MGMSWGATFKLSSTSSWQPLIWIPWGPMHVYLLHSLHPQATSLSLLNGGLTAKIALVHHARWIFNYEYKISWQDFNHLQKLEPLQLSQHACGHGSIIPSLYGGMPGVKVMNDLLWLATKVTDWTQNSQYKSSVDDKVRLLQRNAGFWWKEADRVRKNIMAQEFLKAFSSILTVRHVSPLLHLNSHRGQLVSGRSIVACDDQHLTCSIPDHQ